MLIVGTEWAQSSAGQAFWCTIVALPKAFFSCLFSAFSLPFLCLFAVAFSFPPFGVGYQLGCAMLSSDSVSRTFSNAKRRLNTDETTFSSSWHRAVPELTANILGDHCLSGIPHASDAM